MQAVTQFKFSHDYPSTWVHKSYKAWDVLLAGLGLHGHLMRSRPCDGPAGSHVDRPLPFVSPSSAATLTLLVSWTFISSRFCGMWLESKAIFYCPGDLRY